MYVSINILKNLKNVCWILLSWLAPEDGIGILEREQLRGLSFFCTRLCLLSKFMKHMYSFIACMAEAAHWGPETGPEAGHVRRTGKHRGREGMPMP